MKKAWAVVFFVFAASILLRLAWEALQPLVPIILIAIAVTVPILVFRRALASLLRRRSHF